MFRISSTLVEAVTSDNSGTTVRTVPKRLHNFLGNFLFAQEVLLFVIRRIKQISNLLYSPKKVDTYSVLLRVRIFITPVSIAAVVFRNIFTCFHMPM